MKCNILKLNTVILLFAFISAGCQKDDLVDEHYPFRLHYAIKNEQGQEVNKMKEGEKFSIYFSIENTSDKHASINSHHLFFNDELFNIYNKKNMIVVGTPVAQNVCLTVMGCYGFPHIKKEIAVPYPIKNDTTVGFMCCSYNLTKYPELSAGKYVIKYTGSIPYFYITENHEVEEHETGNYNLKHEFEIVK